MRPLININPRQNPAIRDHPASLDGANSWPSESRQKPSWPLPPGPFTNFLERYFPASVQSMETDPTARLRVLRRLHRFYRLPILQLSSANKERAIILADHIEELEWLVSRDKIRLPLNALLQRSQPRRIKRVRYSDSTADAPTTAPIRNPTPAFNSPQSHSSLVVEVGTPFKIPRTNPPPKREPIRYRPRRRLSTIREESQEPQLNRWALSDHSTTSSQRTRTISRVGQVLGCMMPTRGTEGHMDSASEVSAASRRATVGCPRH